MDDFTARAADAEIAALFRAVSEVARELGVAESGYRLIANAGPDSRQEVPHLHIHICGGQDLGRMIRSEEHTSELQSLMRISYAVFCLKKKKKQKKAKNK